MPIQGTNLNANFKQVFADQIVDVRIDGVMLADEIPFEKASELGATFEVPVVLRDEQGFTYSNDGSVAYALEQPEPMAVERASVDGVNLSLRSYISTNTLERANKALASGDDKAFKGSLSAIVDSMYTSYKKRLELLFLHAGEGLAQALTSTNVNTTTTVVQLTDATWSTAMWGSQEGSTIEFRLTSNLATLVGTSPPNSRFKIIFADSLNKRLTVQGTTTGITALDTALAANHTIFFAGTYNIEGRGLFSIARNSGTLYTINAANYSLWNGNVSTVAGGQLTFGKLQRGIQLAVGKGLMSDVQVLVNPYTFATLNTNQAALRAIDQGYRPELGEQGNRNLKFYGPQGMMEIIPHLFVKEGQALAFPMKYAQRIGACDVGYAKKQLDDKNAEYFFTLENNEGRQLRLYSHQQVFFPKPSHMVVFEGFTNAISP